MIDTQDIHHQLNASDNPYYIDEEYFHALKAYHLSDVGFGGKVGLNGSITWIITVIFWYFVTTFTWGNKYIYHKKKTIFHKKSQPNNYYWLFSHNNICGADGKDEYFIKSISDGKNHENHFIGHEMQNYFRAASFHHQNCEHQRGKNCQTQVLHSQRPQRYGKKNKL